MENKIENLLTKMGAIMSGHFILTSGLHSDKYIEKFRVLEDPLSLDMISKEMASNFIDKQIRDAKNAWIPTTHWVAGFCWHYVTRANRENFCYDLEHIDQESLQYTVYGDGEYYGWHSDADLDTFYTPLSNFNRDRKKDEHRNNIITIID